MGGSHLQSTVSFQKSARMGRFTQIALLLAIFALTSGDLIRHGRHGRQLGGRRQRQGRQEAKESVAKIQGGVDFSGCVDDEETGLCCVEKEETITTVQKDPILECTHKNVEKCHYTYVTQFSPVQEEVCKENFEKTCINKTIVRGTMQVTTSQHCHTSHTRLYFF